MEKSEKSSKYVGVILGITFFLILVFSIITYQCGEKRLTSDEASELVLAELLHEEHAVLSQNWYYSTELRVLNTQLVTAPLFGIFSDWTMIRAVRDMILMVIMVLSYYFFCCNVVFGKKALLLMPLLVWPFSNIYTMIMLFGGYYIPHVVISFLTIGLFVGILKRKQPRVRTVLFLLLAFLAGMGGFRQVFIIYVPLFVTVVFLSYTKYLFSRKMINQGTVLATLGVIAAGGGIGFSNCLRNRYYWSDFAGLSTVNFSIERIEQIVNGILETVGFENKEIFTSRGMVSLFAVVSIGAIVYLLIQLVRSSVKEEKEEQYYGVFLIWTIVMHLLLFLFTDAPYEARYWLPLLVYFFPVLGIYLKREIALKDKYSKILAILVVVCMVWSGGNVYYRWITGMNGSYSQRKAVAQFLTEEKYSYGYAEFWSANVFTELTDGAVRFSSIQDWNTLEPKLWLIRAQDVDRYVEDKVFVLTNKEKDIDLPECKYLNENYKVFENDLYIIYSYENTRQLKSLLPDVE